LVRALNRPEIFQTVRDDAVLELGYGRYSKPLINNNTDRTLYVVFSRFRFFVNINPKAEAQTSYAQAAHAHSLSCNSTLSAWNYFGQASASNLEKTTSSVTSVLLFCFKQLFIVRGLALSCITISLPHSQNLTRWPNLRRT